jgi:hypothetical protein
VQTRGNQINKQLHSAQSASSNGTGAVPGLVTKINTDLTNINKDTTQINTGLRHTEAHLTGICKSTLLSPLGAKC